MALITHRPKDKSTPAAEVARAYVHNGIHQRGGWREGVCGVWHHTLPFVAGLETSMTIPRLLATLTRVVMVIAIAIYPLLVRKLLVSGPTTPAVFVGPVLPPTTVDALVQIANAVRSPAPIDVVLGALALLLAFVPKILDSVRRSPKSVEHAPYYRLAAALHAMPTLTSDSGPVDAAIKLALQALEEELSHLVGDESKKRVTGVTLLEFCDDEGKFMQVRCRTADHEEVCRPVPAAQFMAYYVALEQRSYVEHDFLKASNPFPATRLTVRGSPRVGYRSVLYMPLMCSRRESLETSGTAPKYRVVDRCVGVICVHSVKPYRFWRWGDHKKSTGGFANVALDRSMPYIALIQRLLEQSSPLARLEAQ